MNALKGGLISIVGVSVQQLVSLIGMVILARVLTPSDFGIYALCFTAFLFFQAFIDFGLTPIYIKLPSVNKKINTSFLSINFFFGLMVSIALILLAPVFGNYYENPLLKKLIYAQALIPVFLSISNQSFGQLIRKKSFYKTELISIGAQGTALISAIYLALNGWGPWALLIKHLLFGFFRMMGGVLFCFRDYSPIRFSDIKIIWVSIRQASELTVSRVLTGLIGNVEKLIVGKSFGEHTLGHYERGLFVVEKPNAFRNALTTPAMTYLARMDLSRLSEAYGFLTQLIITTIGLPVIFFYIYGAQITVLLLGDQWQEAGQYVVYLSFLGLGLILKGLTNVIHINELRTNRLMRLNLISLPIIYIPVVLALLVFSFDMLSFVILYSLLSSIFWLIIFCQTLVLFSPTGNFANKTIQYILVIIPIFLFFTHILRRYIGPLFIESIVLEIFCVGILGIIFTFLIMKLLFPNQISNQILFVKTRLSNK